MDAADVPPPDTELAGSGLRTFADSAPDAIVMGDDRDRITYVNPAAEQLFGYAAAEMVGQPLRLIMPERFGDAHHAAYSRYIETGEGRLIGTTVEVVAVHADGHEFPIELALGAAGRQGRRALTAIIRDLTERRRRERHLSAQLAVTAVLAESRSAEETGTRIVAELTRALGWDVGMLWLRDPDGLLRVRHRWAADPEATRAFAEASMTLALGPDDGLAGWALEQRRPVWVDDLTSEVAFRRLPAARASGLRGGVCLPMYTEARGIGVLECFTREEVAPDDDLRDLLMTVASQAAEHLQRRETEERLDDARTRFANAFVHAPIGMALLDEGGRWLDVNPALCRITGRAREHLLGRVISDVIAPDDVAAEAALRERVVEGERDGDEAEVRLIRESGRPVWVRESVSLVHEHGERYLIAHLQDITTARHVAELRERNAVELQRSNAELEAFAHIAAHDLRTPLQTITGFTKLLQRRHADALPPDAQEFLRMVLESAEGSNELLTKLLSYARAGGTGAERVPVDPQAVVEQVLVALAAEVEERAARISIGTLPAVMADRVQLGQVFQNLLGNAIKFTPAERAPEVEVTGRRDGDTVLLSVADRGIGVRPEEAGEVFGMFRRGAGGARYEGSGIGLAVAAKVVAGHGGRLWVETREGGGSNFTLTLPAAPGTRR